jgi:hypothetical protein
MENSPLSTNQVLVITKIENLISVFYKDPEHFFTQIIELIDEYKIAEHEEIMIYLHELLTHNGYLENAEQFAKMYKIQPQTT